MTSQISCPGDLSDGDLLVEVERAAACERLAVSRLIALLMEVDSRKLYAGQGYSSLFTYCTQVLHLSEHAAYLRIEAARAARRFPEILDKLADGSLHLTAVSLLAPHLTDANHVQLLDAARHKSKREIEQLIARVQPQPDVPSIVRRLPAPASPLTFEPSVTESASRDVPSTPIVVPLAPARPAIIKPTAPERYKVQFTMSHDMYERLRRVQDLMRHTVPNGDPAIIFDRALTLLLADLSRAKCGAAERPQRSRSTRGRSRHIPAAVRREVWRRDDAVRRAFWNFIMSCRTPTAARRQRAIFNCAAARITGTKRSCGPARSVCRRPEKRKRISARDTNSVRTELTIRARLRRW